MHFTVESLDRFIGYAQKALALADASDWLIPDFLLDGETVAGLRKMVDKFAADATAKAIVAGTIDRLLHFIGHHDEDAPEAAAPESFASALGESFDAARNAV